MNCTQDFYLLPTPGTLEVNESAIVAVMMVFRSFYTPIHPYLLVTTSLFSFFSNILILIVLSRKEMRKSGINVTMMFIAFCDFGYSGFALIKMITDRTVEKRTFPLVFFQLIGTYSSVSFHAASLFLAVSMAFCRVMSLKITKKSNKIWNSPRYAVIISSFLVLLSFLTTLFMPFMLLISPSGTNEFVLKTNPLFLQDNCLLIRATQLLNAFWFKGFPCFSMSVLSVILLINLEEGKKSQKLANSNSLETSEMMSRSSRLVIRILIVFLLTEIPQAFIALFGGFFYIDYIRYVLPTFGDLTYMLALINSSVAFVFYSILSSKFRRTFCHVFVPKQLERWIFKDVKKGAPATSQSSSTQQRHFMVSNGTRN